MINYKQLSDKFKELEGKYKLNHYDLLQRFMFERLLERISKSKYKDNFILKGGLLLSAMFGIDNRTTRDMDATIKGIDVSKNVMIGILNEIFSIDLKDNVKFAIMDIVDIRKNDEYGGYKYYIVAKMKDLKVNIEIDISTGDEVMPCKLNYKYKSIFDDKEIFICSYNSETILKDIINYKRIHLLWNTYVKRNNYVENIELDNIINGLIEFIKGISIEEKIEVINNI